MATREIANDALVDLLDKASEGERLNLTLILNSGASSASSSWALQRDIGLAGGHGVFNFFRGGKGVNYLEVAYDVANELGLLSTEELLGKFENKYFRRDLETYSEPQPAPEVDELLKEFLLKSEALSDEEIAKLICASVRYVENLELKVICHVLNSSYEKLSSSERQKFDAEVSRVATQFKLDKDPSTFAGAAGVMAIANLGGFATYTLMSSLMSAVSFGTLGFGAYTAASSMLSLAIGPIGWLALGSVAAYKLGKPELEKTIPFVATVGVIRQRIKSGLPAKENPTQVKRPKLLSRLPEPPVIEAMVVKEVPKAEPEEKVAYSSKQLFLIAEKIGDATPEAVRTELAKNIAPNALLPSADSFLEYVYRKYRSKNSSRWPLAHRVIYGRLETNDANLKSGIPTT